MSNSAEFEFDPAQWQGYLNELGKRWNNPTDQKEFIAICAAVFSQDYADHFKSQAGPGGNWPSWSEAYAKHMQAVGKQGNLILQDSGRLRQSFVPSNIRAQEDGIVFYNPAQTKEGFPYAAAHDEGGPKLPQRKFMWLSDAAMARLSSQVGRWLAEG